MSGQLELTEPLLYFVLITKSISQKTNYFIYKYCKYLFKNTILLYKLQYIVDTQEKLHHSKKNLKDIHDTLTKLISCT